MNAFGSASRTVPVCRESVALHHSSGREFCAKNRFFDGHFFSVFGENHAEKKGEIITEVRWGFDRERRVLVGFWRGT